MIKQPSVFVLTLMGLLFLLPFSYGQRVPDAFSYQGIARNADGSTLNNQTVNLEIRILEENGAIAYSAIRQVSTNDQGRFVVAVGEDDPVTFSQINWGANDHSLIVFLNGSLISNAPFLSIPYAFAANTALDDGDKDPTNELQNLVFDSETGLLSLSNSSAPAIPITGGVQGPAGDSFWQQNSSGIFYSEGSVQLQREEGVVSSTPLVSMNSLQDSTGASGSIATYGANGNVNLALGNIAGRPNSGSIGIRGSEGNTGLLLFTDSDDDGRAVVFDSDTNLKIDLFVTTDTAGAIATNGANGNGNLLLGHFLDAPNNGIIGLRGSEGNTSVLLSTSSVDDDGRIEIRDSDANLKVDLLAGNSGAGLIATYGENDNLNLLLGNLTDAPNNGAFSIRGSEGNTGILLSVDSVDDGAIEINDSNTDTKIDLFVSSTGSGVLATYGENNNVNVAITTLADHPNNGFISVRDEESVTQAGMFVDAEGQGIIFADEVRGFTQDPSNENNLVSYAVLEGPELAAYDRGTFQLSNGEAFVPYAQHFKIVSNTEAVTIQVTPSEWDTYGVAVVRKTADGFYVKELKGGTGNFDFDWEVKAVRKGQEDYEVFLNKAAVAKIAAPDKTTTARLAIPDTPKKAISNNQKQELEIRKNPRQAIFDTQKQD